jgi:hypothetical protein
MSEKETKGKKTQKHDASGKEAKEIWTCTNCKRDFKDASSKVLECERCIGHYCVKCTKFSEQEYELLNARPDLHWFCANCEEKVVKSINLDRDVEQRCNDFLKEIKDQVRGIEDNFNKQLADKVSRKEMNDALKEVLKEKPSQGEVKHLLDDGLQKINVSLHSKIMDEKPAWEELVTKEVDSRLTFLSGDIGEVRKNIDESRVQMAEETDRLSRKNNIIVYNVPESMATSFADKISDDRKFCDSLMTRGLKIGYEESDVNKTIRLGKKNEDGTGKVRPLLVELNNGHVKNLVMENVARLALAKEEFKGIIISHDMTKKEREQCKEMVAEAKMREQNDNAFGQSGEWVYRVRGPPGLMKILKLKRRK